MCDRTLREISFLREESRINVSIIRARRGMMIIGSAAAFVATMNYWGAIAQYRHSQTLILV
jgi:superfamily I DNA and/or RNA helicase